MPFAKDRLDVVCVCSAVYVAALLSLSLWAVRPASAQPVPCGGIAVCAAEHDCETLNAMIRRQGKLEIEFESGYPYNRSHGTVEFRARCPLGFDSEPWLVLARDGQVCKVVYFCNQRFRERRDR